INEVCGRLGMRTTFVSGMRVTDEATMDVVRMVLLGQINPELVGLVQAAGAPVVGLAGTDAKLLTVRPAQGPAGENLGLVGEVEEVDPTLVGRLLADGFLPVVATVGRDRDGIDRNVNADLAAGAIAAALGAAKLVYLTDVAGLYRDLRDDASLLSEVGLDELEGMLSADEVEAGMRPKITSIVAALKDGVPRAHIIDGRLLHAILLEVFTDEGVGTMITGASARSDSPPSFTSHPPGPAARPVSAHPPGPAARGPVRPARQAVDSDTSSGGGGLLERSGAGVADAAAHLADLQARWTQHILPTYRLPPLAFVRGQGSILFDAEGRAYLDFLCGLGVTTLGHAHPAVSAAVTKQVATLAHTSNLFLTEPAVSLAERLVGVLGWRDGKAFFCNSGAEANEAAIKLARRHGLTQHPGKYRVVTLEGSFHGRTLATLEATGQTAKHTPFAPLAGYVDHVAYDSAEGMHAAVGGSTCAVLLEVVQGEGGVRPVPDAVLVAAREACDRHGALLVIDEVQTGLGRSGSWFAWQDTPVVPDVVTVAKALANGLPIGACVARGGAAAVFQPGDHATTFGGNPLSCAAALAVLETIEREGLVKAAEAAGERLASRLADLVGHVPHVTGVRGRGLLLAVELDTAVAIEVEAACRERSLICNAVGPDLVRLAPPLTVSEEEIELAVAVIAEALRSVGDVHRAGRPVA
ncbi:MAG: acetylornithine transaminase, partial [Actinomycetota bacterium]|nr:acetylornithine transaminase [Actinomycetota bacterium]